MLICETEAIHSFLKRAGGVKYFEIPIDIEKGVRGWFSTRWGKGKPDNLDNEDFEKDFLALLDSQGVKMNSLVSLKQVHSDGVIAVEEEEGGSIRRGTIGIGDALVTNMSEVPLVIKVADCLSILLYDPITGAIANIHCGWRSGSKNIITLTIEKMIGLYNFRPEEAKAVLMPSISKSNYQVGSDVFNSYTQNFLGMEKLFEYQIDGSWFFDLRAMAVEMLARSGIKIDNMINLDLCTFQRRDLFYSYRRDGESTGRMLSIIMKNKM